MATLKYENWDSVTAPAIPTGWNLQSGATFVTVAPGSSPTPISSPNTLEMPAAVSGPTYTATWGTPDGVSGNVTVTGNGTMYSSGNSSAFSIFCRGSASTTLYASSSCYELQYNIATATCSLNAYVSGTKTTLASVAPASPYATGWFQLTLYAYGSNLSGTVQRGSDGYYLSYTGAWSPSLQNAISVTDSSVTGSGYAGYSAYVNRDTVYLDDWTLSSLSAPSIPPNQPVIVAFPRQYYPAWAE